VLVPGKEAQTQFFFLLRILPHCLLPHESFSRSIRSIVIELVCHSASPAPFSSCPADLARLVLPPRLGAFLLFRAAAVRTPATAAVTDVYSLARREGVPPKRLRERDVDHRRTGPVHFRKTLPSGFLNYRGIVESAPTRGKNTSRPLWRLAAARFLKRTRCILPPWPRTLALPGQLSLTPEPSAGFSEVFQSTRVFYLEVGTSRAGTMLVSPPYAGGRQAPPSPGFFGVARDSR